MNQFTFKPVTKSDRPQLLEWFKKPHVDQWWPVPAEQEDFFRSFLERIRPGIKKPYLVLCDDKPIGYIQSYSINNSTHSWLPSVRQNEIMIGIDQFIGEEDYLYKGFGPGFIKTFIDDVLAQEHYTKIIVDPEPQNTAAIRCYEKVGFNKLGEFLAPWGPALVMVYQIQK